MRTLEDEHQSCFIVNLAAFILFVVTENSQQIALLERKGEAERLGQYQAHFLAKQVLNEDRRKPVGVRVVAASGACGVDMLQRGLHAYLTGIEAEMKLPWPETNLSQFRTYKEL